MLGFLDVNGAWDPSLAFVRVGAVAVAALAFFAASRRPATLLGGPMLLPEARGIDARLVGGSVLFGIGWGLAGFCPGPAVVAVGMGQGKAVLFVAAMLVGMAVFEGAERLRVGRLGRVVAG